MPDSDKGLHAETQMTGAAASEQSDNMHQPLAPEAAVELRIRPGDQSRQTSDAIRSATQTDNPEGSSAPAAQRELPPEPIALARPSVAEAVPRSAPMNEAATSCLTSGVQVTTTAQPAQPMPAEARPERAPDPGPEPETPPKAVLASQLEPPVQESKSQPQVLRSLALEFAPDGTQDVRVRLTEREGNVHISLHSADNVVAGRLRDGIHDLVGSLAGAGYDVDAWTSGRGRNQQEEPRQSAYQGKTAKINKSAAEEFGGLIDQTAQETI